MEGCNFKIRDRVSSKGDVERWAVGGPLLCSPVTDILETKHGRFISNENRGNMLIDNVIPESEAKSYALKFLAARMAKIAGA